jgi:hypothetical protein
MGKSTSVRFDWKFDTMYVGNIMGNNFVIGHTSVGHLVRPVGVKRWASLCLQVEWEWERETLHKGPFSFSRLFNTGVELAYLTSTGQTKWPTDFWHYKVAPYDISYIVSNFKSNRTAVDFPIRLVLCPFKLNVLLSFLKLFRCTMLIAE